MKLRIITLLMVAAILVVVLLATIPVSAAPGANVCDEGAGQDYMYFGRDSKNRDIARCFAGDGTQVWRIICSKSITEVWVGSVVTASCSK
jgi:hypothetical protein